MFSFYAMSFSKNASTDFFPRQIFYLKVSSIKNPFSDSYMKLFEMEYFSKNSLKKQKHITHIFVQTTFWCVAYSQVALVCISQSLQPNKNYAL